MSPSPESTPSSQSASSSSARSDEPLNPVPEPGQSSVSSKSVADGSNAGNNSALESLVPKRPLMRPVSRPLPPESAPSQTPSQTASQKSSPPTTPSVAAAPTLAIVPSPASTSTSAITQEADPSVLRQQPISPPSEPKQYRAIGLLRGRYVPSAEQFTRGEMIMGDGTVLEAVLLGRIMSLVKNYLDLEKEHLWVVYPRTREMQNNLHAQIVGVWEPEKLRKPEEGSEDEAIAEAPEAPSAAPSSPGYEDDYFSIRGEILFYAPDRGNLVVRIQQAPRKTSDKAKAFKLLLNGTLSSERTLGYFWDLQVKRHLNTLVVVEGSVVGLIPPRKRDKDEARSDRRSARKPDGRGASANRPPRSTSTPPVVRREALPKPAKRTEKNSD